MWSVFFIDEKTLREARLACGASTDTETIRLGLESLIRQAAYQRLRKLRGSEKDLQDVPEDEKPEEPGTRLPDGAGGHVCLDSLSRQPRTLRC